MTNERIMRLTKELETLRLEEQRLSFAPSGYNEAAWEAMNDTIQSRIEAVERELEAAKKEAA